MKKTLFAAVASAFLFMGASCSSTDLAALVEQVQKTTASTCAYVPTAQTILQIFQTNNAQLQSAVDIAAAICAAVKPAPTAGATPHGPAKAGGVVVNGYFVK